MKQIIQYIIHNYPEIIAGGLSVYELLARIIPTVKNYTLLNRIVKILQAIDEFFQFRKPKN